eukprot:4802-Pelagococcus_subviridis.AAC.5
MITSAYFFEGLTNVSNIGFTNVVYCEMTPSTLRPRSTVSRFSRRASRKSSSVSTKIFMWHRSRTSSIASTRIPSMMMTSAGSTRIVSSPRECVTKSYTGTSTGFRSNKSFKIFTSAPAGRGSIRGVEFKGVRSGVERRRGWGLKPARRGRRETRAGRESP